MKMKKAAALFLTGAMALSLAACGSSSTSTATSTAASEAESTAAESTASGAEETTEASGDSQVAAIQEAGKIVMATNAEFEPFEYKDGNETVGIDVDIAQKIADSLGVELEISDIAFDSTIPALTSEKADFVAAGMTVTEERLRNVDFTDSYFNASQVIIVPVDSDITSREDLNGKTVGVQEGTTGDIYCTNQDGSSDINVEEVMRYPKGMDAVSDLLSGRLDAVVIDNYPAQKLVEKNPDKIQVLSEAMTEEEYAIACQKDSDLTAYINDLLAEMQESGELDEIVNKYIGEE